LSRKVDECEPLIDGMKVAAVASSVEDIQKMKGATAAFPRQLADVKVMIEQHRVQMERMELELLKVENELSVSERRHELAVGPYGICYIFCPNSLCSIPKIQPVTLGLCPIMPEYADRCAQKTAE
jgi:hypothetical protein